MGGSNLIIGLAVLAWLLYRQLQVKSLRQDSRPILLLVLAAVGVLQVSKVLQGHHVPPAALVLLGASLLLGAVLGAVRATTVRVWAQGPEVMRQGTWITALLWLVSIGLHLAGERVMSAAGGPSELAASSMLLYLAVSWLTQGFVLRGRAVALARPLARNSAR